MHGNGLAKGLDSDSFIEFSYERLCADTLGVFKQAVDFCQLEWTAGFEQTVRKYQLKNIHFKWQQTLTADQQRILQQIVDHSSA